MIAVRGLRTRLMVAYALFFAVFLTGLAIVFRTNLESTLAAQEQDTLKEEWESLKGGYLRIDTAPERQPGSQGRRTPPNWIYDTEDPDEKTAVLDIQKIFLITDHPEWQRDSRWPRPATARCPPPIRASASRSPTWCAPACSLPPRRPSGDPPAIPDGNRYLIRSQVFLDEGRFESSVHISLTTCRSGFRSPITMHRR